MSKAKPGNKEFDAKLAAITATLLELQTYDAKRNSSKSAIRALLEAWKPIPKIAEEILGWREKQNSHPAKLHIQKDRAERGLAEINRKIERANNAHT